VDWDVGEHGTLSSAAIMSHFKAGMEQPELAVARNDGNTADALSKAAKVIEADYFTPYLAHATMEPMVCTAWLQGEQLDVWCSTQNPEATLAVAAATAGVAIDVKCSDGLCGVCARPYDAQASDAVEHRDFVLGQQERQHKIILCCSRAQHAGGVIALDF
jgi:hypothetical protein